MTDPKDQSPDFSDLRQRAEERLKAEAVHAEQLSPAEAARLIHELQVHQIELEMQNDELRLSQARLEESRTKYVDLYDFAPVGYLTLDEAGKIVEANLAAATLLGVDRSRLLDCFFTHFLVEADRPVFQQLLNNSFDLWEQRQEFHLRDGNGDVRTILLDILFLRDAEGRERRRISLTDISELKRIQEELRLHKEDLEDLVAERTTELVQANEQLREANEVLGTQAQVLTSMAEGVTVTDNKGNILYTNPAFDAMFGYEPGELVGRHSNILNYYPPEENTRVVKAILESVHTTGVWSGEFRNCRKNGKPFFTSARISAIEVNGKKLFISVQEDISERQRTQEALKESEERYRSLFQNNHAVMLLINPETGDIIDANPAACAFYGYPKDDLVAKKITDINTLTREEVFQEMRRARDENRRQFHFRHRLASGEIRDVEVFSGPIRIGGKGLLYSIVHDITERQRAEEAVIQAKEEWERTFDSVTDYIAILDRDHRITRMNRAMAGLLGKAPEEVLGLPCYMAVHGLDEAPDFCPHTRVVATGRDQFQEVQEFGRIFAVTVSPLFGHEGELMGSVHVARDITERKRAEEMLYRQAELLELAHDAILVRDLLGRITFWNRGAIELYGWTREEALGQTSHDLLNTEFAESLPDIEARLLDQGHWLGELRHMTKDGRRLVISSRWTLRRDAQGKPQSVLVINTDITEHKQAEEALQAANIVAVREKNRLEALMEALPVGVALLDDKGGHIRTNRMFEQVWGEGRPLPREVGDYTHYKAWRVDTGQPMRPEEWASARVVREGKAVYGQSLKIQRFDGTYGYVINSAAPILDAQGKVAECAVAILDVTELQEAQEALRERTQRYELVVAGAGAAIWDWDVLNNRVFFSAQWKSLHGYGEDEDIHGLKEWSEGLHPEDAPRVLAAVEEHFEGKTPVFAEEYRILCKDGSIKWVFDRGLAQRDESGRVVRMAGSEIDITGRKAAEQALRKSEERLRLALDAAYLISFEWDIQRNEVHRFVSADPTLAQTTEQKPSTFEAVLEAVHPEDRELFKANVFAALQREDGRYENEFRIVHPDGEAVWLYERGYLDRDERGHPVRLIGLSQDITQRKQAEVSLRESREDLNRAQAVAHTGSWRMNVQKNELTWSDENHRIFGIPPGTPMTYETFLSTIHPEDLEYVDRKWQAALKGEPYDIEHRLVVDGQVKWVRERAELELDQEGRLLGGFGTTQDITQRKAAEQEIRRLANFPFLNPNPVLEVDETGRVLFANPAACQVVEKLGLLEGVGAFIPSDLEEKFAAVRQGGPRQYSFDLPLKDTVHTVVLSFPHDLPTARLYALDITERKEMEEALKEAQARTAAILDSISDSFFALDRDMVVTYYNRASEKVLGRKAEEVLGKKLFDAFPEARGSIFEEKYSEALRTGKAMAFETYFDVPPFENWYDVRVYPFGQGLSVYFQVSTERKKAGEMLRRAHDELEIRVIERTQELQQAYEHLMREMEEHQETADRLRESEARFTAFMQHLPGPAVMRDVQGRYLFANESWEGLTGLERHSWEGKTIDDVWPQELAQKFKPLDYEILSTGKAVEHIEELELPDGRHYFLAHRFPVLDEDGLPYMVGAVAIDITARQRAEAALALERQRLFAVLETIPAYVALLAPDYTVPFANQEFVRRFGEAEEGQRCYEFLFGRTEPCPDCVTFKVFETNQPLQWEWLGPDGRTYAVYDYPFADTDGSPLILEMGVDITDRQQAEAALKKNEAMLRLILDTLPVGVWVTDKDGQITQSNPAARKIWAGARYVGIEDYGEYKGWWADTGQLIAPEEWALARAVQKGETSLGEIIDIQCFDGSRKTIINSAEPLFGDNREILGAIVVNEDITAMREAEKVMREQTRQVEAFFAYSITPFVFLDRDFNFLRVNEAYARACHLEIADFVGRNHFELYPHAENEAIFRRVVETKTPFVAVAKAFEFPDHPEWGVTYWDWTLVPILDDTGEVDFLVFSLRDVTERKRAELEAERQAAVVAGINRIFREALTCETREDLGRTCLAVAEELSGSRFGFIDVLNEEGTLDFLAVSDPGWKTCRQAGKKGHKLPTHVPVRGIYRSVIEEGTPLIANDPASHPDWRGLPKGHPALTSYLGIPLRNGREVIGQMGVGNREGGYSQRELETLEALGIPIVEAILHKQAKDALQESAENLHILTGQLLEVQETERRRMSRELHDELGQSLLLLKFKLSSINAGLPRARRQVREECQEALQYLDDLVNEVRRLSRDLSPSPLEELGLTSALRHLLNEFRKHYKIDAHSITIEDVDRGFAPMVEINIYRIFQEILTNVGKHAGATQISVTVKKHDNRVSFAVRDNGKGFTVSEALAKQPGERGIGLASIQERLRMLGGTLVIQSRKGAGTRITFTVPLTGSE